MLNQSARGADAAQMRRRWAKKGLLHRPCLRPTLLERSHLAQETRMPSMHPLPAAGRTDRMAFEAAMISDNQRVFRAHAAAAQS